MSGEGGGWGRVGKYCNSGREGWSGYPSGRAGNFANDIGEDDEMVDTLVDDLAPLSVLSEPDVIALEGMRHTALVRLLPVSKQEAGCYLLAHPVPCHLIILQPVSMTLSTEQQQLCLCSHIATINSAD